ncbi:hypothetical protein TNCV_610501 [Trichonephila clavipes]|nr:hypothetical protein TNCV_610501 [Trichonephila clavipes]
MSSFPSGIKASCVVTLGLDSNLEEGMDVCKCIVPVFGKRALTLNSRRAASTLVKLVEGEERWRTANITQKMTPTKISKRKEANEYLLRSPYKATRWLLVMDVVNLDPGQVTTSPELAATSSNFYATPTEEL